MKMLGTTGLRRFAKFIAVGASGTVVNLGLLAVLSWLGASLAIAAAVAIELSILWNFICNDKWTFSAFTRLEQPLRWWQRCWRYHLIVGAGALLNYVMILTLAGAIGVMPAGLAGMAMASLWNFAVSRTIIYKGKVWLWSPCSRIHNHTASG